MASMSYSTDCHKLRNFDSSGKRGDARKIGLTNDAVAPAPMTIKSDEAKDPEDEIEDDGDDEGSDDAEEMAGSPAPKPAAVRRVPSRQRKGLLERIDEWLESPFD